MKIQDLAIMFVLIILPISLVLSAYTQYQIKTLNTQTLYDAQLTAATYDAIKAYQINAENSTTSELSNSKVRDISASVSTFKNSIMSAFRLNGYSEDELNNYIPALVYTMYDGFYIYAPFENVNYQYDESGNETQGNGENIYGLKPYIPYSCRYIYPKNNFTNPTIDVTITYSLENYITVQGMIDGEYVNESGYLIDGITVNETTGEVKYNEVIIQTEQLKEYLPIRSLDEEGNYSIPESYPYAKYNGTKYYLIKDPTDDANNKIVYLSNGKITTQCEKGTNPNEFEKYYNLITNNDQAIQYYKKAKNFTKWVKEKLNGLKWENAYYYAKQDDGTYETVPIWSGNVTTIFVDGGANPPNIENELSNFNQHRLEVIRHTIESNLSLAIANYNNYSKSTTNDFQMPKLKEDEWDYITHNISLISFLQGLHIGGKIYNGYTIVTNTESKEVVLEADIYILGQESEKKTYHKIGDAELENGTITVDNGNYTGKTDNRSAGRLNLDFKRKFIIDNNNTKYYYPLKDYNASYTSVIMQDNVNKDVYKDIYGYVNNKCSDEVKTAFYTALGREREAQYKGNNSVSVE